jgi:uncharacterized membrane protein YkgB
MSSQVTTAVGTHSAAESVVRSIYERAAKLDRVAMGLLRLGLIVVLCWIGGLKFADYEADGIVPLVANSPLMSFFYHYPAPEYRKRRSSSMASWMKSNLPDTMPTFALHGCTFSQEWLLRSGTRDMVFK